jgi:hypothetical protein
VYEAAFLAILEERCEHALGDEHILNLRHPERRVQEPLAGHVDASTVIGRGACASAGQFGGIEALCARATR